MRTFIAIFPPEEVQKTLASIKHLFAAPNIRRIQPQNIHLTLKFLRNVPAERLDEINAVLEKVAGRHESFRVEPHGLGAFPSLRKARVLWAGVREGTKELSALADDVEDSLSFLGFGREKRRYQPHITLGRARKGFVKLEEGIEVEAAGFVAWRLALVGSELRAGGVVYSVLESHPLGA